MRWNQGRATVERMLAYGELQRVPASRGHADHLIEQARKHLTSADEVCAADPEGGYALVYDAARKALTAALENQGLRPTTRGGHLAVYEATRAQLDPPMGRSLRAFDRMRRQRHEVEYPPTDAPALTEDDIREDLTKAAAIVDLAARVLDRMSPF
ncbi:MAG: HEPN domain-containing protein [Streptosporangiaceae bacterium]